METLIRPNFSVRYNGRDISADLSAHLVSLTYTDKVEGESDEIQIRVEDSDGRWRYQWLPAKGDKLDVSFGLEDLLIPAGVFEVDEVEISGPPDQVDIKGLAVPITSSLRTKKSYAHEVKKLSQIAATVAREHGLTLTGTIDRDILIERTTQHRETDLAFLNRLAGLFGYVFNVRGSQLIFTSVYDLESSSAVMRVHRRDLIRFNLKDRTGDVYKAAKTAFHNPDDQKLVESQVQEEGGIETQNDVLEVKGKAENRGQADEISRAALHRSNTRQQEGTISLPGSPLVLAGVNIELVGMGRFSGVYHVQGSTHSMVSGGYSTDAEIKKVSTISEDLW